MYGLKTNLTLFNKYDERKKNTECYMHLQRKITLNVLKKTIIFEIILC